MTDNPRAAGPRRSRAADRILTKQMWSLWVAGETHREIGERYGIATSRVSDRLARYRRSLPEPTPDELLRREVEVVAVLRSLIGEVLATPAPPLYSHGRPVVDEQGRQAVDHGPRLRAVEAAVQVHDRVVRLHGLAVAETNELEASAACP